MSFDRITRKLLALLQQNNQLTSEAIGQIIGISASTVQRRLQNLRKSKVIEADVSILSPELLGQKLMVIMDLVVEREDPSVLSDLRKIMSLRKEVMQCYYVTGREADFVLITTFPDMQAYEKFCEDVIISNKNIKRFYSSIVIKRVKYTLSIPTEDSASRLQVD